MAAGSDPHDVLPADVVVRLQAAYQRPCRWYHTWAHATTVAGHVVDLGGGRPVLLAAWFHDAVYEGRPHQDEAASAALLRDWLPGDPDAAEAARLVLLTAGHDPAAGDGSGAILCDADLAVLGSDPASYAAYRHAVRQEYAGLDEGAWRIGRRAVLRSLLARPALFRTPEGKARWEVAARGNLRAELHTLGS